MRDGRLARVAAGLYLHHALAADHEVRCRAVSVWGKGAVVIAGASALHLLDGRYPEPARIAAAAPSDRHRFAQAWAQVTLGGTPPLRRIVRGIPVMLPGDAVIDAWCRASPHERKGVVYEALWLGLCSAHALEEGAARRHRVAQRQVLDRILRDFRNGATSPTEVMARRDVFRGPRFAELEWQVPMQVRGRARHADALHRRARVVIELDGDRYHSTWKQRAADRERDADFAFAGWLAVRLGYADLRDRPGWCRATVAGIIASRLAVPHHR